MTKPEAQKLCEALLLDKIKECERLHEVNQMLVSALSEAVMLVGDWGAYASEYFQNKHELEGDINRLNAIIAKATGESK